MTWATVALANLQDVSTVEIQTDGSVLPTNFQIDGQNVDNYAQLRRAMRTKAGWVLNLPFDATGTTPSTRSLNNSALISSVLLFTTYTPSQGGTCDAGSSRLYAVNYLTGTAFNFASLGEGTATISGTDYDVFMKFTDLGPGLASTPVVHRGKGNAGRKVSVFTQSSTGAIPRTMVTLPGGTGGRRSWAELPFE